MALWHVVSGETPIDDFSELKIKGITRRAELNVHEAENIRRATVKYLAHTPNKRTAPFRLSWVRRLHREMFGNVWVWAGRFRTHDLNIGVSWPQIEPGLQNLLDDLTHWKNQGIDLNEQGAWLHHKSVQIHPFTNGNGRWARLLANIWLKQHKAGVIEWPETLIGTASEIRDQYLAAIKKADDGNYHELVSLHKRYGSKAVRRS